MRIVVIGDGKVGRTIVEHLCKEGHEVIIIDNDEKVVENMINQYDIMGICGNGASYEIQNSARVDKSDVVICATSSDEVNILSSFIAKQLKTRSTIARVRSYDYDNEIDLLKRDTGITMTINPEREAANEILNIINFPEAIRVDSFAKGNVDLVELFIPDNNPLVGLSLASIYDKYQVRILVCAVQRNDEVFIPTGSFKFMAHDHIHITAPRSQIMNFINKVGLNKTRLKNVMIIGGSKVAYYLAKDLLLSKYDVKIIEQDYNRCVMLSEILPKATIINADGTDQSILEDEGIKQTDAIISLTGSDEVNIIISMYANNVKTNKVVAKVNTPSFAKLLETVGVASVISPKDVTASRIISYVRALNNMHGSNIITLYKLVDNKVEAVEFLAKNSSKVLNIPLKVLKLKSKVLIASIIRNNEVIIPSGNDSILEGDSVIVVTAGQILDDLNDILE